MNNSSSNNNYNETSNQLLQRQQNKSLVTDLQQVQPQDSNPQSLNFAQSPSAGLANISMAGMAVLSPAVTRAPHLATATNTPTTTEKQKKMRYCTMCPYKTFYSCDMKAHLQMHGSPKRLYPCANCSYSTMRINALRTHELLHNGLQPVIVVAAVESTTAVDPNIEGAPIPAAVTAFSPAAQPATPVIASSTPTQDALTEEASSNRHIKEPSVLGAVWRDAEEPEVTLRIVRDRSSRFIGEKRCRLADYNSGEKHEERLNYYRCSFCYDRFDRYAQLFEHIREHFVSKRGKTRYMCKDCDFTAETLMQIRNHKRVHIGDSTLIETSLTVKEKPVNETQHATAQAGEECSNQGLHLHCAFSTDLDVPLDLSLKKRGNTDDASATSFINFKPDITMNSPLQTKNKAEEVPQTQIFENGSCKENAAPLLDKYSPYKCGIEANRVDRNISPVGSLTLESVIKPMLETIPPVELRAFIAQLSAPPRAKPEVPLSSVIPTVNTPESMTTTTPMSKSRMCTRKRHLLTPFATTRRATAAARTAKMVRDTSTSTTHLASPQAETTATSITANINDAAVANAPKQITTLKKTMRKRPHLNADIDETEEMTVPAPMPNPSVNSSVKNLRLQCTECPFECTEKVRLEMHVEMHSTGRRPFKCDLCTYNCFTVESLRSHEALHSSSTEHSPTELLSAIMPSFSRIVYRRF